MMIPNWLSLIDVAFIGLSLIFAMKGLRKGFAGQVAQVLTIVSFSLFLFFGYPVIHSYLGGLFQNLNETYIMWLILAGLVALAVVLFILLNKLLANVLKAQISTRADHVYGFSLGLFRGIMISLFIMTFLVIFDSSGKIYDKLSIKSHGGKFVCDELAPRIQPHMTREALGERVNKLRETLIPRDETDVLE